jgi:hypothetical protein
MQTAMCSPTLTPRPIWCAHDEALDGALDVAPFDPAGHQLPCRQLRSTWHTSHLQQGLRS